ncbi:MAG: crotonase/enoyl-CoA hydratase family protein [Candidatus Dormibacteria bacterium]
MSTLRVTTERRGHLWVMTLNRPEKRNAFDSLMVEQLALAYGELDRDPELRCGVLAAEGAHFTGGLDLGEISPKVRERGFIGVPEGGIDPLGVTGPRVRKPVVAAVQGICLTIGIELMLAADIRVAASDARFGQIEVKRGIFPFGGATVRFVRDCGWGNAMRYLLTGDEFDATEAYRIGLVQEVVETGRQLDRALELAQVVADQAPLAVQESLKSSRTVLSNAEQKAFAAFPEQLLPLLDSEDAREGLMSFLERRRAEFTGR